MALVTEYSLHIYLEGGPVLFTIKKKKKHLEAFETVISIDYSINKVISQRQENLG